MESKSCVRTLSCDNKGIEEANENPNVVFEANNQGGKGGE